MANIFDPIRIGKIEAKNRIMFAPTMTNFANPDGSVSDRQLEFLRRIAEGDVGIIVKGHAYIDEIASKGYKRMQGAHRSGLGLEKIPKVVKAYDCVCLLQLNHIGPKADPALTQGPPRGPSPQIIDFRDKPVRIQMLSREEIEQIVKAFGEAAARAEEAGFDGVEVHGAHNYLISQFISPKYNLRQDKYGGDLKGRLTIALEVVSTIRKHVSADFILGFRFNGAELIEGGLPLEEGIQVGQTLEKAGVDYLNVSQTSTVKLAAFTTTYDQPGNFVYIPEKIKQTVSIPVAGVGALHRPELIQKVLQEGKMDMVAICRGLIAEPEIVRKMKENRAKEERQCIRCNLCLQRTWDGLGIMCTINPLVGRELTWDLRPVSKGKRVMVVGGGVAGMEAARIAAIRGHEVSLHEANDRLGGQALAASIPRFTEVFRNLLQYYEAVLTRLKVDVRLRHKVSAEDINAAKPDVVILATGAGEKIPDLPGANLPHVATGTSILFQKTPVKGEVAIIGGSMIGCQVALYLAEDRGCRVKLISRRKPGQFASELEYGNQTAILERIESNGNIAVYAEAEVEQIREKTLLLKTGEGTKEILADSVVFVDEFVPVKDTLEDRIEKRIAVFWAGDCVNPKNLLAAIHGGASVAYKIDGSSAD